MLLTERVGRANLDGVLVDVKVMNCVPLLTTISSMKSIVELEGVLELKLSFSEAQLYNRISLLEPPLALAA